MKKVGQYAWVSSEGQDAKDRVSIDQQLADMQTLCERNGWDVTGAYVDRGKTTRRRRTRKREESSVHRANGRTGRNFWPCLNWSRPATLTRGCAGVMTGW
jgi:hypothetical protein